jgi:hypothetical protein
MACVTQKAWNRHTRTATPIANARHDHPSSIATRITLNRECKDNPDLLSALIAVTGALIEHGPVSGIAGLVVTFLALHEPRIRAITLLNQAEDQLAPSATSRPREPSGT